MKSVLILIFSFFSVMLNAQKLTPKQAIDFAEKLYQVEILSEEGKNILINKIKTKTIEQDGMIYNPFGKSTFSFKQDIKKSSLLFFCAQSFGTANFYRLGISEEGEKIRKAVYKDVDESKLSEEELHKLEDQYQKRIVVLEGPSIESQIVIEDSLPINFNFVIYPFWNYPTGEGLERSIHNKRSVVGKTRTSTLNDLLKIGLITKQIYEEALPKIKSNILFSEGSLLNFLNRRSIYYEDFEGNKKAEIKFLKNLKNSNLLTETGYNNLLKSYKPFEIKEKFDYIAYCKNALYFDLIKYSNDPQEYYPQIFNEIKEIIQDFDFKNLKISVFEDTLMRRDSIYQQNATISFEVNGRTYKNTFYHNFINKKTTELDKKHEYPPARNDFHKGINKWLADINSDKRLYFVSKTDYDERTNLSTPYSDKAFGLILMAENQFKAWGEYNSYFFSNENHDNTFNTEGVQKIINEYKSIGLFSHLTSTQIDSSKMRISTKELSNYGDILLAFPNTVVYFDWESGNLYDPYKGLTSLFAKASRGVFVPENIVDDFMKNSKNKTTLFGFTFKGKRYEKELKITDDWLDPDFMELIKTALKEQAPDIEIYSCLDDGQASGYIVLNKKQYEFLMKNQPNFLAKH